MLLIGSPALGIAVRKVGRLISEPEVSDATVEESCDLIGSDLVIPHASPYIACVASEQVGIANRTRDLFPCRAVTTLAAAVEDEQPVALFRDVASPNPARPELGMLVRDWTRSVHLLIEPLSTDHRQSGTDRRVGAGTATAAIEPSPHPNLLSMSDEVGAASNTGSGRGTLGRHQDNPLVSAPGGDTLRGRLLHGFYHE